MVRAIGILALAACGCTAGVDDPRLTAIEPARVSTADVTPAVITGSNLRAGLHLDLDSHDPATVDEGWAVLVADAPMPDTHWRNQGSLAVTIPSGLPVGTHDVRAIGPDGTTLVLADALVVTADDAMGPDAMGDAPADGPRDAMLDGPPDAVPDALPDAPPDADETPTHPFVIEVDPLGDGTSLAFVTSYRGHVVVGPNTRGTAIATLDPDGTNHADVTFHFERDVDGNEHDNPALPYRSIGATGCTENTSACGPNNESVRGVLAGVTISGTEWLVIGGGHANRGLEYLYMSSDPDPDDLDFRYVDIKKAENGEGYTSTAIEVLADRLYIGALGKGGAGPLLVALTTTPPLPGLDATTSQAISMKLSASPIGAAGGTTEKIDAIGSYGRNLYVANPRGWLRSTSSTPSPYGLLAGLLTWIEVTPTASAFQATIEVKSAKLGDLFPADRAVPQMATFGGRFYVARNTTTGPQLWVCMPGILAPNDCNSGNWRLVAPAAASAHHTQLGDALLPAISMLAATGTHLYVGFDSPAGVEVFRTASTAPTGGSDFVRIGTPGLGMPTATHIMDGKRLVFTASDAVWLTIGSPATPVTLVKLP